MKKLKNRHLSILCLFLAISFGVDAQSFYRKMESWITSPGGLDRLACQGKVKLHKQAITGLPLINITPSVVKQPMLGFGGTFMDADIYNFMRMGKAERIKALKALFDPKDGAGWNLMRISFGSSDWDRDWNFYTYDDMPAGLKDDAKLSHFSVAEDVKRGHFELIKEALKINPNLKIYAAVWGPPAWMKDNDKLITGGTILPEYYDAFALYLSKAIQAYEREGIHILSVSPQNEPLCTDGRVTPQAQYIDWHTMRDLVKVIRKTFQENSIKSQIWIFDHNFVFAKGWVEPFISDPANRNRFDGVAWHDYMGSEQELCELTRKYPDVPMYLTERSAYTIDGLSRILSLIRCGARSYNHWVTISDEYSGPYQWNGGSELVKKPVPADSLSALSNLRDNADIWQKTPGYYNFTQLSKFVKHDARLIGSTDIGNGIVNTAFENPDGNIVLVVANTSEKAQHFVIKLSGRRVAVELPARSAGTYILK